MMKSKILILNGPNLNYLGKREPDIYGNESFIDYLNDLRNQYKDIDIKYFQNNIEGELINKLYEVNESKNYIGVVFNAGAYTHTSIALHDCIKAISIPVIEVHISNVAAREDYRKISYLSDVCKGTITGFGYDSYKLGIEYLAKKIDKKTYKPLELVMPSSKSELQRALLIAACENTNASILALNINFPLCDDVYSCLNTLSNMDCKSDLLDNRIVIHGGNIINSGKEYNVNVGESGTTLRMLIGIMLFSKSKITIHREGTLAKRNIAYAETLTNIFGAKLEYNGDDVILYGLQHEENKKSFDDIVSKQEFILDGSKSSQYISGVLIGFAFCKLFKEINLSIKNVVSREYIDITKTMLQENNNIIITDRSDINDMNLHLHFDINPTIQSICKPIVINPDFSSIAAITTAAYGLKINNFKIIQNSSIGYLPDLSICEQPDKIFLGILKEHNLLNIELKGLFSETEIEITYNGQNETPFEISIKQFPDLFPYLATVAILSNSGTYIIHDIDRLANKESNRALAILNEFNKFGANCTIKNNDFIIKPLDKELLLPDNYIINTYNDHRIAMALAILILSITNNFDKIKFDNEKCLNKSYPSFMEDLKKLIEYKNA